MLRSLHAHGGAGWLLQEELGSTGRLITTEKKPRGCGGARKNLNYKNIKRRTLRLRNQIEREHSDRDMSESEDEEVKVEQQEEIRH